MEARNEIYQLVRYANLAVGLLYMYYYALGGSVFLLGVGSLNIAVWVFTRKTCTNGCK